MGIGVRAARIAFQKPQKASHGKGLHLPVTALAGNRGGTGGKVRALAVERCTDELKAKLGAVESRFEAPVQGTLKVTVAPWPRDAQTDRLRIIAPITDPPDRTPERAETCRAVAAQRHLIRGVPVRLAGNTLRDRVRLHERHRPVRTGACPANRQGRGGSRTGRG